MVGTAMGAVLSFLVTAQATAASQPAAQPILRASVTVDYDLRAGRAHQDDFLYLDSARRLVVVETSNDPSVARGQVWATTARDRLASARAFDALQRVLGQVDVASLVGDCSMRSDYGNPEGAYDITFYGATGEPSHILVGVSSAATTCDAETARVVGALTAFGRSQGFPRFGVHFAEW